ncbi:transferase [Streptomyces sp. NPDC056061]|uniref:transferase n=1 Tax=Streptomyces sp. NPDC056061 TaxID=3345700 RepID=UPI0035E0448B
MTAPVQRPVPRADCTADPDGTIAFALDDPGFGPGPYGDGERPELVFRLRGGTGDDAVLRLPLRPADDGRLRAVLPGTAEPAEGRWDARLRGPGEDDDAAAAVEPGIRDLRDLVDQVPGTGRVAVRIPYPTADGRLALRCWVRSPHAEAGAIGLDGNAMTVEGSLYGARLGDDARAEARAPGDPGRVRRVPVTGEGNTFSFTLPLDGLVDGPVAEKQLWTLWLIPGEGADEVRISRLLDDVWDRRNIFVHPDRAIGGGVRATPCYTGDNDLCVRVEPGPSTAG